MALVTAATEKFSNKTPVGLKYTPIGTVVYEGTSSIVRFHESSRCSSITEDDAFEEWDGLKKPLPKMGAVHAGRYEGFHRSIAPVNNDLGFDAFPPEILQEVVVYLPDNDLNSFSLVQRAARDAVIPANARHWRQRFRDQFDLPPGKSPAAIKEDYTYRKRYLTHLIHFKYGYSADERACLKAVRQLIVERSRDPVGSSPLELDTSSSLNVRQLWRFMKKSNLLHDAFRWTRSKENGTDRLLEVIQVFFFGWNVCCATHNLHAAYPLSLRLTAYSVEQSEALALAPSNSNLVDAEGQINFSVLSHLTNLWKFHLAINDEGELRNILLQLPSDQHPMTFSEGSVRNAPRLGMRWKGALFHSNYMNSGDGADVHTEAYFTGGDRLLSLTFTHLSGNGPWPEAFEKEIEAYHSRVSNEQELNNSPGESLPMPKPAGKASSPNSIKIMTTPKSGAAPYPSPLPQRSSTHNSTGEAIFPSTKAGEAEEKHFFGLGECEITSAPLNIAGIVHPLPPQCGVPGWQRFTMVAYDTPASGSEHKGYLDADEADLHPFLRYEGVVLPGDSIIVGRYSMGDEYRDDDDPNQFLQRGTFIYWLAQEDASDDDGNQ
ncbi:MAG: hypothetical protein Q9172_004894 [Xanthocarpia lactea]